MGAVGLQQMGVMNAFEIDFKTYRMGPETLGLAVIRDDCFKLQGLFGRKEFVERCSEICAQEKLGLFLPIFYFTEENSGLEKKMFFLVCDESKAEIMQRLVAFLKDSDMDLAELELERVFGEGAGSEFGEARLRARFVDMRNLKYNRKMLEVQLRNFFKQI